MKPWIVVLLVIFGARTAYAVEFSVTGVSEVISPFRLIPLPEILQVERVENAPVSARISTETIQVLADGNRIVNIEKSLFYRDAKGRTRREQKPHAMGWSMPGTVSMPVTIDDPVTGFSWRLDESAKKAVRLQSIESSMTVSVVESSDEMVQGEWDEMVQEGQALDGSTGDETYVTDEDIHVTVSLFVTPPPMKATHHSTVESLGSKMMQGVSVDGTRYSTTFPAGEFGNERPLVVKKSTWYSPELQMMIFSQEIDPRIGTTTYKVDILTLDEPDRQLFKVPKDFEQTVLKANEGIFNGTFIPR